MVFRRTFHILLLPQVVGICFLACSLPAAELPQEAAHEAVRAHQGAFHRPVGQECEEDKAALAKIKVSLREEQQVGERVVKAYLAHLRNQGIRVTTRGRDVDYLRGLVATIRPLMKDSRRYPRIKVCLAESSRCNARSFPGGTLVFFRGLLECAPSEAAVVGIVGHELSHLDRGHHLWRLRRVKLARQTLLENTKGSSPDDLSSARTILTRIWTRPFLPEYEMEADRDGASWAYAAGYDPREMAKMCLHPRPDRENRPAPGYSFTQTHPSPRIRHRAITQHYKTLQQEQPNGRLYAGKENLLRRETQARHQFSE